MPAAQKTCKNLDHSLAEALSQRIQLSCTQQLTHRNWEIINICCFKPLSFGSNLLLSSRYQMLPFLKKWGNFERSERLVLQVYKHVEMSGLVITVLVSLFFFLYTSPHSPLSFLPSGTGVMYGVAQDAPGTCGSCWRASDDEPMMGVGGEGGKQGLGGRHWPKLPAHFFKRVHFYLFH